jgi:hypothetical protein
VTCERAPSFLGAYVLGALDPDETRAAEQHLAECPACAAELREFRELTALLDRVPLDEVTAEPVTPSPELFDRVAAAAVERRPVRSVRRPWAVAAVAAAVLAAGGITWAVTGPDEDVRTASAGDVRLTVATAPAGGGTALDLTVAGLAPGSECRVVVVDDRGGEQPFTWTFPGGTKSWDVWSEVPPDELADVRLFDSGGDELVRVPLED